MTYLALSYFGNRSPKPLKMSILGITVVMLLSECLLYEVFDGYRVVGAQLKNFIFAFDILNRDFAIFNVSQLLKTLAAALTLIVIAYSRIFFTFNNVDIQD